MEGRLRLHGSRCLWFRAQFLDQGLHRFGCSFYWQCFGAQTRTIFGSVYLGFMDFEIWGLQIISFLVCYILVVR